MKKEIFNKEMLAYCAAFIDGEGCLRFDYRLKKNGEGKKYMTHMPTCQITNTDFDLIELLYKHFGEEGSTHIRKPRLKTDGVSFTEPQMMWQIQYKKLYRLLQLISPFILHKDKKHVAKEIIEWYQSREKRNTIQ